MSSSAENNFFFTGKFHSLTIEVMFRKKRNQSHYLTFRLVIRCAVLKSDRKRIYNSSKNSCHRYLISSLFILFSFLFLWRVEKRTKSRSLWSLQSDCFAFRKKEKIWNTPRMFLLWAKGIWQQLTPRSPCKWKHRRSRWAEDGKQAASTPSLALATRETAQWWRVRWPSRCRGKAQHQIAPPGQMG